MEFYQVNAPDPDLCSFMYPDPQPCSGYLHGNLHKIYAQPFPSRIVTHGYVKYCSSQTFQVSLRIVNVLYSV